jgi:hypothetical protein
MIARERRKKRKSVKRRYYGGRKYWDEVREEWVAPKSSKYSLLEAKAFNDLDVKRINPRTRKDYENINKTYYYLSNQKKGEVLQNLSNSINLRRKRDHEMGHEPKHVHYTDVFLTGLEKELRGVRYTPKKSIKNVPKTPTKIKDGSTLHKDYTSRRKLFAEGKKTRKRKKQKRKKTKRR